MMAQDSQVGPVGQDAPLGPQAAKVWSAGRLARRSKALAPTRPKGLSARLLWPLSLAGLLASCTAPAPESASAPGSRGQSVASPDGDLTVASAQILNRYAALTSDAALGATQLRVDSAALSAMNLQAGDLLLIAQLQGAAIDTSAGSASHGTVTMLGSSSGQAGRFELVNVTAVNPATGVVSLSAQCGGLRNAYSAAGHSQIVRVPQYGQLSISASGSVSAQPWDGQSGGILALRAQQLHIESGGRVTADAAGFRGGQSAPPSGNKSAGLDVSSFAGPTLDEGGQRGEGIAGGLASYGRGAAANGGGGGNAYGAGGGGGANAGLASSWSGNGVMRSGGAADTAAWGLDPAGLTALSNDSGGGRGGYSLALNEEDATSVGPGDPLWGGNARRERGGRGGYPLSNSPGQSLFLGGGGGAGDRIDPAPVSGGAGSGGRGGGLVYILADLVDGAGSLSARGGNGAPSAAASEGGAGGGGGGGSIVVNALAVRGSLTVNADGGDGGSQLRVGATPFPAALGPGGGGGGGYIALPSGTPASVTLRALGGRAGTSQADVVSEFPSNGATDGHAGSSATSLSAANASSAVCTPVDLRIAVTGSGAQAAPDTEASFLISVYNDGPYSAVGARVTAALAPRGDFVDWLCTVDAGDASLQGQVACSPSQGINSVNTQLTLTPGARAKILLRSIVPGSLRGPLSCSASVAASSLQSDPDLSNNQASDSIVVGPEADLELSATAAPSPTRSGQSLTYVLSVRNHGPSVASGLTLTFDVPDNAQLLDSFAPFGEGWSCQVTTDRRQVICTREELARGGAPDVTLALQPDFADTFVIGQARVTATSYDPDLRNNDVAAVASITYDSARYRRSSFGGGGFSCRLLPGRAATTAETPRSLAVLLGLTALGLATRRLSRSRRLAAPATPQHSKS